MAAVSNLGFAKKIQKCSCITGESIYGALQMDLVDPSASMSRGPHRMAPTKPEKSCSALPNFINKVGLGVVQTQTGNIQNHFNRFQKTEMTIGMI